MASRASAFRNPRIAVFSGSAREGSFNVKLAKAAEAVARGLGAETNFLDISSYQLPIYDQDKEAAGGLPAGATELKAKLAEADAWIVSSPEYNGFVTPLILNAFTWCSRGDPPGSMYATFKGKTAVVLSASPGAMGGMRSLNPHRQLLQNLGVNVLPASVAVGGAFKAFNDNTGALLDDKQRKMLEGAVASLFYAARDEANREATCELIRAQIVGEYGAVDVAK